MLPLIVYPFTLTLYPYHPMSELWNDYGWVYNDRNDWWLVYENGNVYWSVVERKYWQKATSNQDIFRKISFPVVKWLSQASYPCNSDLNLLLELVDDFLMTITVNDKRLYCILQISLSTCKPCWTNTVKPSALIMAKVYSECNRINGVSMVGS